MCREDEVMRAVTSQGGESLLGLSPAGTCEPRRDGRGVGT